MVLIGVLLWASGCDTSGSDAPTPTAPVASIAISPGDEHVAEGFIAKSQGVQLLPVVLTVEGDTLADPSVAWSSSNEAVLTVSATGEIRGRAVGTATITATIDGKSDQADFQVLDMTGTWEGLWMQMLNGVMISGAMTFVLNQDGVNVTGQITNAGWSASGADPATGTISGALQWNQFRHTIVLAEGCRLESGLFTIYPTDTGFEMTGEGRTWTPNLMTCANVGIFGGPLTMDGPYSYVQQ